jgi:hypothetical protein
VKWCGGERLGCELYRVGKKVRGGRQSSLYRDSARRRHKEGPTGFHCARNQWNRRFPERIQVFVFLGLNPPPDFLLYSRCHQSSMQCTKWRTEQTWWGYGAARDGASRSGTVGATRSASTKNRGGTRTTWAGLPVC